MDYTKCYKEIIENAKLQTVVRKHSGNYFENHHILPKSLGGSNDSSNLVMLTPREHFICHWLLVKMYNKGTNERMKMLCAFWRMRSNPTGSNERYVNSRAYEKLRIEFSKHIGEMNKHFGNENSQFGKHWFTNRDTGESKTFSEQPNDKWVAGRNLFQGETSILKNVRKQFRLEQNKSSSVEHARKLWDKFHSGSYNSITEMSKEMNQHKNALFQQFKKYIPLFSYETKKKRRFVSDKNLIGVYE